MHQIWRQLFYNKVLACPSRIPNHNYGGFHKPPTIGDTLMKSLVIKRSVVIDGHKTSVSLEDAFWRSLKEIARTQQATLSNIVAEIDKARQHGNLSSAIRLFVLDRVRAPETDRTNGLPVEATSHGIANCEFDQQIM